MFKTFLSMGWAVFLMFIFAFSIATATLIEKFQGTSAAWLYVYGTHWLEIIMAWLILVLLVSLFKFRLLSMTKIGTFLFHFSFVVIAVGAIISRYFGFEGAMNLRLNNTSDAIILQDHYIQICNKEGICQQQKVNEYDNSGFLIKAKSKENDTIFTVKKYAKSLEPFFINSEQNKNAKGVLFFTLSNGIDSAPLELFDNESVDIDGVLFEFDAKNSCENLKEKSVCFGFNKDVAFMRSNLKINPINFKEIEPNIKTDLKIGELYRVKNLSFLARQAIPKSTKSWKESQGSGEKDGFLLEIKSKKRKQNAWVVPNETTEVFIGKNEFSIKAFRQSKSLPFKVRLDDFILQRYPGSLSPSTYFAKISIIDSNEIKSSKVGASLVYDYKGYRLFLTSYDKDEKGCLLSISFDPSRYVTYTGYGLLCIGLLLSLINKKSRFQTLLRQNENLTS